MRQIKILADERSAEALSDMLMDAGALQGDEHGCIDLSRDMIRGMVIGKRYADARSPRYATIDDVPGWAREETQRLIDRGAL